MKRTKWAAAAAAAALIVGLFGIQAARAQNGSEPPAPAGPMQRLYWRALGIRSAPLRLRVVDAHTMQPIAGAGCVVAETGDRVETGEDGVTPVINAPIFRHPRLEQMLAQLHGQLTVICYKKGYRDAIYMGVRMHEDTMTDTEVWMHAIGRGDRRIEPTLYQMPIHRLFQIQLADKYRIGDQGEGPERPELTRPDEGPAPQESMGLGRQSPLREPTNVEDLGP